MANAQVSAADVLFYRNAPTEPSFRNRIIGLIALPGIGIDITVLPLAIGTAALAGARFDDLRLLPLLVTVFLAAGVANMVNDIVDAERDKAKWPLRPLATGLLSRSEAVLFTAIWVVIGIVMAITIFNWLFLALGLLVLVLNFAYSRYLRDNVGYLTVMLPLALAPVGIWAAFSPATILTPLPWLLAIFLALYSPVPSTMQEALDPAGSHPLHSAPPHCREGTLRSVRYRLVYLWRSDLIVCTVILALRGGTSGAYGVALNSGKKFGRR